MNNIVKLFLSLSLSGSILILALIFFKRFMKNRISRQWQYYIWLVVIARLLLPIAFEVNLMGNTLSLVNTAFRQTGSLLPEGRDFVISGQDTFHTKPAAQETAGADDASPFEEASALLSHNLWLVWLVLALVLLIRKITIYQSFVMFVRAGQIPVTDIELLDCLAVLEKQAGVKKAVELCVNPLLSTPLLIGFFRPCIILPTKNLKETEFKFIVLHELTHYKRLDMVYKWLVQLTVCLHWFNPFVYLMGREINKACELSCDEAIISNLDWKRKQEYGRTLLDAMKTTGTYKESIASVTLSENKILLKERLGAIMNFRPKSKLIITLTAALSVVFCLSATVLGAYTEPLLPYIGKKNSAITTSPDDRILNENGVYYIFSGGATQKDKPNSSVTEGDIMLVLVEKNRYTSIGPFSKPDKLAQEVLEQCEYMVKHDSLTRKNADKIMEAAEKIQASFQKEDSTPQSDAGEIEISNGKVVELADSEPFQIALGQGPNQYFDYSGKFNTKFSVTKGQKIQVHVNRVSDFNDNSDGYRLKLIFKDSRQHIVEKYIGDSDMEELVFDNAGIYSLTVENNEDVSLWCIFLLQSI